MRLLQVLALLVFAALFCFPFPSFFPPPCYSALKKKSLSAPRLPVSFPWSQALITAGWLACEERGEKKIFIGRLWSRSSCLDGCWLLCYPPATADLFYCECFPVRTGNAPRKGRKWDGDESRSRWAAFHGRGKRNIIFFFRHWTWRAYRGTGTSALCRGDDSRNERIICSADLNRSGRHNTEPFDETRLGMEEVEAGRGEEVTATHWVVVGTVGWGDHPLRAITVPCEKNLGQRKAWQVDHIFFAGPFQVPQREKASSEPGVWRQPGAGGRASSCRSNYSLRPDSDSEGTCYWNGKHYLFVICYEAVMGTPVPLGRVFPASTRAGCAQPLLPSLQVFPFLSSIMKSVSRSQFIFSFHRCWQGSAGAQQTAAKHHWWVPRP